MSKIKLFRWAALACCASLLAGCGASNEEKAEKLASMRQSQIPQHVLQGGEVETLWVIDGRLRYNLSDYQQLGYNQKKCLSADIGPSVIELNTEGFGCGIADIGIKTTMAFDAVANRMTATTERRERQSASKPADTLLQTCSFDEQGQTIHSASTLNGTPVAVKGEADMCTRMGDDFHRLVTEAKPVTEAIETDYAWVQFLITNISYFYVKHSVIGKTGKQNDGIQKLTSKLDADLSKVFLTFGFKDRVQSGRYSPMVVAQEGEDGGFLAWGNNVSEVCSFTTAAQPNGETHLYVHYSDPLSSGEQYGVKDIKLNLAFIEGKSPVCEMRLNNRSLGRKQFEWISCSEFNNHGEQKKMDRLMRRSAVVTRQLEALGQNAAP